MRLQDLNWMDVERYLQRDNRIILITGSTEQHAYLSLLTDILIPSKLALAAAERENVLIAPPLNFGQSDHFADFPGTITLSRRAFDMVLVEIVEGLMHQGFARFLILNGHGGNAMPQRLLDLHMDGIIRVTWYNWWREQAVKRFEAAHNLKLDHANWGESFTFNRVSKAAPSGVKPPVRLELREEGRSMREILGDGNYGGPYQVDDALMQAMFDQVVDEIVDKLRQL